VVGQDNTLKRIEVLRRRGLSGRAYWLSGQSGTGKTTIARLIAAEIADDFATLGRAFDKPQLGDFDYGKPDRHPDMA